MITGIFFAATKRAVAVTPTLPCLLSAFVSLFMAASADAAIRNGNFTNNAASGWTGTGGGAGAPRVATNGTTVVVRIGTNSTAGVPGVTKGKLAQNNFTCDPTGGGNFCVVTFTATFTQ